MIFHITFHDLMILHDMFIMFEHSEQAASVGFSISSGQIKPAIPPSKRVRSSSPAGEPRVQVDNITSAVGLD